MTRSDDIQISVLGPIACPSRHDGTDPHIPALPGCSQIPQSEPGVSAHRGRVTSYLLGVLTRRTTPVPERGQKRSCPRL